MSIVATIAAGVWVSPSHAGRHRESALIRGEAYGGSLGARIDADAIAIDSGKLSAARLTPAAIVGWYPTADTTFALRSAAARAQHRTRATLKRVDPRRIKPARFGCSSEFAKLAEKTDAVSLFNNTARFALRADADVIAWAGGLNPDALFYGSVQ